MPLIPNPNVPIAPGVPALSRDVNNTVTPTDNLLVPAKSSSTVSEKQYTAMTTNPWAILADNGERAIQPDTFVKIEPRKDREITSHPVEKGSFSSYNKTAQPEEVRLILVCSGHGQMKRDVFLAKLDQMIDSLDVYTITTPEKVYKNMNLHHIDSKRESSSGVTLLAVECWFTEVRATAVATTTHTAMPSGAEPEHFGMLTSKESIAPPPGADLKAFGVI